MRAMLTAGLMATMLMLGCKEDNNNNSSDMTVASDLTASGGTHCGEVVTCVTNCGADGACRSACVAAASTSAQTKFSALVTCSYTVCLTPGDAGAAACTSSTDTSAGCRTCVAAASQSSSCSSQLTACLGD